MPVWKSKFLHHSSLSCHICYTYKPVQYPQKTQILDGVMLYQPLNNLE